MGGELELALGRRHPVGHAHAVGHVHRPEALDGPRRGEPRGLEGRHHPVEQRQRHARPESPQHRPAGQTSLGDEHQTLLIACFAAGRPSSSRAVVARFRQRAAYCLNTTRSKCHTTSPSAPPVRPTPNRRRNWAGSPRQPTPREHSRHGATAAVAASCAILIWNGRLSTMPRISDDHRWSSDADSLRIRRTAGMSWAPTARPRA